MLVQKCQYNCLNVLGIFLIPLENAEEEEVCQIGKDDRRRADFIYGAAAPHGGGTKQKERRHAHQLFKGKHRVTNERKSKTSQNMYIYIYIYICRELHFQYRTSFPKRKRLLHLT